MLGMSNRYSFHDTETGSLALTTPLKRRYYSDADGLIFVVDAADIAALPSSSTVLGKVYTLLSIRCLRGLIAHILPVASLINLDPDIDIPIAIIANKSDVLVSTLRVLLSVDLYALLQSTSRGLLHLQLFTLKFVVPPV